MTALPTTPITVEIGHATDDDAQTGCTVLLFSAPTLCAVDVRGGAPGTRETDLLRPGKLVQHADAILLTGGSAFGLAAADGVMSFLRDQGRGFATSAGPVPIVPAAVIFDLDQGKSVAPTAAMGRAACEAAGSLEHARFGRIGAGRGATVAKITGNARPGGIGMSTISFARGSVTAIAVVNALGNVPPTSGQDDAHDLRQALLSHAMEPRAQEQTTLIVLLLDTPVDKDALIQATVSAHDGMARAIVPCHTPFDGDLVFAAALRPDQPAVPADLSLCIACELATESAIRDACRVDDPATRQQIV